MTSDETLTIDRALDADPGAEVDAWMADATQGLLVSVTARLDLDAALRRVEAAAAQRCAALTPRLVAVGATEIDRDYVPRSDTNVARAWFTATMQRIECAAKTLAAPTPTETAPVDPTPAKPTDTVFARLKTQAFHELVESSVAGDKAAMGTLFAWLHPAIVRYCRARIGRTGSTFVSADDIAQEIMLAVLGALPRYTDDSKSFLPFVYGIAAHKVADFYRRSGCERTVPVADVPDTPDTHPGPETTALHGELSTRIAALLDGLPARQREILILRLVVGLSAPETAEAIGLTATAVRIAQHRALTQLRGSLTAADWL
jgi:RNA polymerase sigma-70 factor (ECF subfamily)